MSNAPDDWLAAERERLLGFGHAAKVAGGFAWLDDTGRPDAAEGLPLWVTARMTHVYALGHLLGHEGSAALCDHGVVALRSSFRDDEHGGWYAALDAGTLAPMTREKTAYEHAFVVLGAASATAAGRPDAADLLSEALEVFSTHFWDDEHQMVVEQWSEDFARLDGYRGVNANMHAVEALLTAADVTGDAGLRDWASAITRRVVGHAEAHDWRIPEHYDEQWRPLLEYNADKPADPFRPYGSTVGHGLEWARLALHLHAASGSPSDQAWLVDAARALFDRAVADGWAADGADGFCYTVDWQGQPVVRERMHWVAAEAIAAAAALSAVTGASSYADKYAAWWAHIRDHFIDLDGGSWWHELGPDLAVSRVTWRGKPDLYHAVGATLLPVLPVDRMLAPGLRAIGERLGARANSPVDRQNSHLPGETSPDM